MVCSAAGYVQLPASNPFIFKDRLKSGYIRSVLLYELDVKPRVDIPWNASLSVEIAPRISATLFLRRE
jgi:hypothetical protein